jgi:putative methylase
MRRRDLEAALAGVPSHADPKPELEQYRTPDKVAADLLWAAGEDGAVRGRHVLDLGCGTGVLGIAAALLGAARVTGVDVDARALAMAAGAAGSLRVADRCAWVEADVAAWAPVAADTVVMNPPFGAQAGNRHADKLFLRKAADCVRLGGDGTVWTLAQVRTEPFLGTFAKELKFSVERVAMWDYPLVATMAHHEHEVRMVQVGGYRLAPL